MEQAVGVHLIIDGFECSKEALSNMALIEQFLQEVPDLIGMTKIRPVWVQKYEPPADKPSVDWGFSGGVLIAESHLQLHTFPDRQLLWLDVFSCKAFDVNVVVDRAVSDFSIGKIMPSLLNRGFEYPPDQVWFVEHTFDWRMALARRSFK